MPPSVAAHEFPRRRSVRTMARFSSFRRFRIVAPFSASLARRLFSPLSNHDVPVLPRSSSSLAVFSPLSLLYFSPTHHRRPFSSTSRHVTHVTRRPAHPTPVTSRDSVGLASGSRVTEACSVFDTRQLTLIAIPLSRRSREQ